MKSVLTLLALLLTCSVAQAATLTPLKPPAVSVPFTVINTTIRVTGYNAAGNITGNCTYIGRAPNSGGHGGGYHPAPRQEFTCTWSPDGTPIGAVTWDGASDVYGPVIDVDNLLMYESATLNGNIVGWNQNTSYLVTP